MFLCAHLQPIKSQQLSSPPPDLTVESLSETTHWFFTWIHLQVHHLIMSVPCRTQTDARVAFQSCKSSDPKDRVEFYDNWVENYEKDHSLMSYRSPHLAVDFLSENFSGSPEEARVLDVACGTGWVAKLMAELGFRHFMGVDGSKGMLEQAAKTGLYQDLKLALLGPEPLPAPTDTFDVVIVTGGMDAGFIPVSAVREFCDAAKPGGFVCISRGDHTATPSIEFRKELERELQLMEDEGLWSPVGVKETDKYMENPHLDAERVKDLQQEERYISGRVYLYKKSIH
ncbi:methyltransferase-like protein 27 isoform X1 [Epinephelus fuscoguttatus]|uniref:methyltransferase-like protein 27 isoform X1 n=2 Tax=Epinephelus fuscoguttatus TaxID=293821 RepID=UPI0020CFEE41|nr:methyltransferase-like protein 27 isoform X1 [Epinephelus fuscoguttatus]